MCAITAAGLREVKIVDDSGQAEEAAFRLVMATMLSETVCHELCHEFGVWDEEQVDGAIDALMREPDDVLVDKATAAEMVKGLYAGTMVLRWVSCPNTHGLVDWDACFECDDFDKHPTCPLRRIRMDAAPRTYTDKRYHVSELGKVRYAFYDRNCENVWDWQDYWAMMWGRGFGDYVEMLYEKEDKEASQFVFETTAEQLCALYGVEPDEYDDFIVIGHADVNAVELDGLLMELKTQHNLKYVANAPNPGHVFQLQAYYTLMCAQYPEKAKKIKELRLVYFGRTWRGKGLAPYIEHVVPMDVIDLRTRARMMRMSEETRMPPEMRCEDWLCRYCDNKASCRADLGIDDL